MSRLAALGWRYGTSLQDGIRKAYADRLARRSGYSMRLTPDQAQAIRQRIYTHMGQHARIWLFGSRVDDSRRGGDVDLYVEPETAPDLTARLRCKSELADALDLKVDLIVQQPDQDLPIYRIAKRSGVRL